MLSPILWMIRRTWLTSPTTTGLRPVAMTAGTSMSSGYVPTGTLNRSASPPDAEAVVERRSVLSNEIAPTLRAPSSADKNPVQRNLRRFVCCAHRNELTQPWRGVQEPLGSSRTPQNYTPQQVRVTCAALFLHLTPGPCMERHTLGRGVSSPARSRTFP